jgi:glutaconate CoA-transferase subunit B
MGYAAYGDLVDMFTKYAGRGYIDVCFLGCAQIDKYGNINSVVKGDYYENMEVRFPGAGGSTDFLAYAKKTILTMRGGEFVEKLAGLPADAGPYMVITTKGVFKFDKDTKEIYLVETFPGITVEEIQKDIPWELKVADDLKVTKGPTDRECAWIRDFDPVSAAGRTNALGLIARAMGERKKKLFARRNPQLTESVTPPSEENQ